MLSLFLELTCARACHTLVKREKATRSKEKLAWKGDVMYKWDATEAFAYNVRKIMCARMSSNGRETNSYALSSGSVAF